MKTAMQKLIANLETMGITFPLGIQQTFLSIEKEQIENAFYMGRDETTRNFIEDGEEYYNQKYKPETI